MLLAASLMGPATAMAQSAPLVLETKIPLGEVSGRIDHLGIDPKRQRLFVAELGNDSLGVVDLAAGKVLRTMAGFSEPQGVAYVSSADSIYVANGGDGSVRVLRGDDLAPIGRIELGDDADNVRVDAPRNRVLVGYGKGALAVIDPATRTKSRRYPSQRPSREFSARSNRHADFYQRAGCPRDRGGGPGCGDQPLLADAGRCDRTFQWRSTGTRIGFLSSFAARRS